MRAGGDDGLGRRKSVSNVAAGAAIVAFLALAGWMFGGLLTFSEPSTYLAQSPIAEDTALESAPPALNAPADASQASPMPARSETSRTAGNSSLVDETWVNEHSSRTGIPLRALLGYAGAELAMSLEAPACHIGWSTLAAIGRLESGHGTHAGSSLSDDGFARPSILGPDLDGAEYDQIDDTDGGDLDGSATTDRAVGPLQFIPSTWQRWGADGNGDGRADPQQIDDASLAAARYLCVYGDLSDATSWRRAVFAYNHVESYVNAVSDAALEYTGRAGG